jgi:hypothetical protein
MVQQVINVGATPNDGDGDSIRNAFIKCNDNFSQLYSRAQSSPPPTLVGSVGDEAGMYAYDSTYFYFCFANYDGSSVIWAQVTQVGNIVVPQISNGTSNVVVDLNGNVTIGIAGTSNVVVFTGFGTSVTGNLSATGNVTGNYIIGDGSLLTNLPIPGVYGNTQVAEFLPTYTGNLVSLTGDLNTTANISGNYIIGDGSLLTNVNASNVSVTKISNGFSQVNIPVISSDITVDVGVVPNLAVFSSSGLSIAGNVLAASISTSGNVVGTIISGTNLTGTLTTASQPNITSVGTLSSLSIVGNVVPGNVLTTGYVSVSGNITGNYIYGNGYYLTGITGGGGNGTAIANGLTSVNIPVDSGNVEVTVGFGTNVAVFTSSGLIINGTLSAANVISSNVVDTTGNVFGGNIITSGQVTAIGNVSGQYFVGNGYYLTGITTGSGTYGNSNVAAYLPTYTGNISGGNLSLTGTANVSGNVNANVNGVVTGQLYGLVNAINIEDLSWDFGYIAANTYTNPVQYLLAATGAGNIDMGTVSAPASLDIDIGTIF